MSKFGNLFDDEEGVGSAPAPSKEDAEKPAPVAEPVLDEEASKFLAEKAHATAEATSRIAAAGLQKGKEWGGSIKAGACKALADLREASRARKEATKLKREAMEQGSFDLTTDRPMSTSLLIATETKPRRRLLLIGAGVALLAIAATAYWLSSKLTEPATLEHVSAAPVAAPVETVSFPDVEVEQSQAMPQPALEAIEELALEQQVAVEPEPVLQPAVEPAVEPEPFQQVQKSEPAQTPAAPISTTKPVPQRAQPRPVSKTLAPHDPSKEEQQVQQIRDFAKELDGLR